MLLLPPTPTKQFAIHLYLIINLTVPSKVIENPAPPIINFPLNSSDNDAFRYLIQLSLESLPFYVPSGMGKESLQQLFPPKNIMTLMGQVSTFKVE